MTKQCSDCGEIKAISEFPESHPGKPRRRCQPCYNAYQRKLGKQFYARHKDKERTEAARYRATHAEQVAERNREQARKRLHDTAFRERMQPSRRARGFVVRALQAGKLVRPSYCQECFAPCMPDAAHADYTKPLVVRWLCRSCHRVWDAADPKTLEPDLAQGSAGD